MLKYLFDWLCTWKFHYILIISLGKGRLSLIEQYIIHLNGKRRHQASETHKSESRTSSVGKQSVSNAARNAAVDGGTVAAVVNVVLGVNFFVYFQLFKFLKAYSIQLTYVYTNIVKWRGAAFVFQKEIANTKKRQVK